MAVVARNHVLIQKTGEEVASCRSAGILRGNALWVLTPGRSIELADFRADTRCDANNWDGARPPKSSGLRGHGRAVSR